MSLFTRNAAPKARARSPSIESILSATQPSTLGRDDHWVIFNPSETASESSYDLIGSRGSGLALPAHDGAGEFPEVPREMLMDRVSRWSSEQSRIVYEELQRLEQRFLWINSPSTAGLRPDQRDGPRDGPRPSEPQAQEFSWKTLAHRVHNIFALEDEVLDMLFGDGLATPRPQSPSPPDTAFARSKRAHPGWDTTVVQHLLGDLGVPLAPNFSLLREILSIGLPERETQPVYPLYTPPLTRDYWEEECSSLSTEIRA